MVSQCTTPKNQFSRKASHAKYPVLREVGKGGCLPVHESIQKVFRCVRIIAHAESLAEIVWLTQVSRDWGPGGEHAKYGLKIEGRG